MDLRQLRYFVKVVECRNITRASEALFIAQPSISQQMRNLERDLGVELLERSVNGVVPTAAGQTLYRHALDLLMRADSTRNLLLQDSDFPQGKVSVGMPSSTARILAIPLARTIKERYPGILLELTEAPTADIEKLLSVGRVDLVIVPDYIETHGVASQHLLSEALYLLSWPDFPVPSDPVSLAELARMPLILPRAPNVIRKRIEAAMIEASLACEMYVEASSSALLVASVLERLGLTILPWSAAHTEVAEHKIKLSRIDHRLFVRDLSLCWLDTQALTNAVQKVKSTLLELVEQHGRRREWIG